MSIRKCVRCHRFDFVLNLTDDSHYHYWHTECDSVAQRNRRRLGWKRANVKSRNDVYICPCCGRYDIAENLDFAESQGKNGKIKKKILGHHRCVNVNRNNSRKLTPMKEGITHCQITDIKFSRGNASSVTDHDHDTLKYRATICRALNTLEGAAKFIMKETGCDTQGVKEYLDALLAIPGIDLGLEPYPELGYATYEEAEAVLNEITN